jgi:hypothetical protein
MARTWHEAGVRPLVSLRCALWPGRMSYAEADARNVRIVEVAGSSPVTSTKKIAGQAGLTRC